MKLLSNLFAPLGGLWSFLTNFETLYKYGDPVMTAKIIETNNGYALLDKSDLTIGTYSRRRDAVRGAARRGFSVAA